MFETHYDRGLFLPAINLWLDPAEAKPVAFVSHAHSDHTARHAAIIASAGTARMMQARIPGQRIQHIHDFQEVFEYNGAQLCLLPAGHIFGSAQLRVENESGSLLYTGDFKLRHGKSAEPAVAMESGTLVMETTFGLPRFVFPPPEIVTRGILKFCMEALEEGFTPILYGYSLGKAQEILCTVGEAGLPVMLHSQVYKLTKIYEEMGFELPAFELLDTEQAAGKVVICAPNVGRSKEIQKIKKRRTAILSGWAMVPGAHFRYQCDAAFPLSDHADYPDLLRYVEMVKPKRVLTLHGYAAEFAADLRARGVEAWSLTSADQLELTLNIPFEETATIEESEPATSDSPFHRFASTAVAISEQTGRLAKIEILSAYFKSLAVEELSDVAVWLTGRPFPQSDPRVLQLGWAIVRRTLLQVAGLTEAKLRTISRKHADAGLTALEVLNGKTHPAVFQISETANLFQQIYAARGPIAKAGLLTERLARITPLEAAYLIRIMSGDLRIGLKEGLVEEALASAFDCDLEELKEANMLTGDVGRTAVLAKVKRLQEAELTPFHPIKCMLANPEPSSEAIYERIVSSGTQSSIWIEDKFDGIRAQIHADVGRAEIYTRDLKRVSTTFEELVDSAAGSGLRAIFDGEIVASENGSILGFSELQKRLGRKTRDLFLSSEIPVVYHIFDLLWQDEESLVRLPLKERRKRLEQIRLPANFTLVKVRQANSPAEIEAEFSASRLRRNEGLIVKDPNSPYTPGRRGIAWLKLKKELTTLDVVVVAAEWGHGKRNGVLSDYTFAVRDETDGRLAVIGKAYSGLTDEEIRQLTEHFLANTVEIVGRTHRVRPDTVLEISFDAIQSSTRHDSNLALRFPRIKGIRKDKRPEQIDTLGFAKALAERTALAHGQTML